MSQHDVYLPVLMLSSFVKSSKIDVSNHTYQASKSNQIFYSIIFFINIIRKLWSLKKMSRDLLFPLVSKDLLIIINDIFYMNAKKKKKMLLKFEQ